MDSTHVPIRIEQAAPGLMRTALHSSDGGHGCLMASLDIALKDIADPVMVRDLGDVVRKIDAYLNVYPGADLYLLAKKLEIEAPVIEQALREVEGITFREFQTEKRLAQAFAQLGSLSPAANGPYEIMRARRRLSIPRATVQYCLPGFWKRKSDLSNPCPLVDLSCDGLALLVDALLEPRRRMSLWLKIPGENGGVQVEGWIVYAVATGIAGYRYRIGVQFLPFTGQRGGNPPASLEILRRIEQRHTV